MENLIFQEYLKLQKENEELKNKLSDKQAELAKDLVKAQRELEDPKKNGIAKYGYYVTLDALLSVAKKSYNDNNLFISQKVFNDGPNVGVELIIYHTNGAFLSLGKFVIIKDLKGSETYNKKDGTKKRVSRSVEQLAGAVLTYERRYQLASALGIAQDIDNDGNIENDRTLQNYLTSKADFYGVNHVLEGIDTTQLGIEAIFDIMQKLDQAIDELWQKKLNDHTERATAKIHELQEKLGIVPNKKVSKSDDESQLTPEEMGMIEPELTEEEVAEQKQEHSKPTEEPKSTPPVSKPEAGDKMKTF